MSTATLSTGTYAGEDEVLQYRAIHIGAVLGIALAVLLLAFTLVAASSSPEACMGVSFLNLAPLVCCVWALSRIRREPERYSGQGMATNWARVVAGAARWRRQLRRVCVCHGSAGRVFADFVQHDEAGRIAGAGRAGRAAGCFFARGEERFHQGLYSARFDHRAAWDRSILAGARQQSVLLWRHVEDQVLRPDSGEDDGRSSASILVAACFASAACCTSSLSMRCRGRPRPCLR